MRLWDGVHDGHEPVDEAVFVDGEFRPPSGGGLLSVRDKASGEIFAVAGLADQADVDAAVASARAAQCAWASAITRIGPLSQGGGGSAIRTVG